MSEWISVKDREPSYKEPVLYARVKKNGPISVGIAYWTVSKRWIPEMESISSPSGFTHWMPLPDPPITP